MKVDVSSLTPDEQGKIPWAELDKAQRKRLDQATHEARAAAAAAEKDASHATVRAILVALFPTWPVPDPIAKVEIKNPNTEDVEIWVNEV